MLSMNIMRKINKLIGRIKKMNKTLVSYLVEIEDYHLTYCNVDKDVFYLLRDYVIKAINKEVDMVSYDSKRKKMTIHFKDELELSTMDFHEFYITDSGIISLVLNELHEPNIESWDRVLEIIKRDFYPYATNEVIGELRGFTIIPIPIDMEVIECEETYLNQFSCFAHKEYMYDTPYDEESEEYYFLNDSAAAAYKGEVYCKDFSYFYCDNCEKYICEQNPGNGYETHYASINGIITCNKCYKEFLLENGITRELIYAAVPGAFFDTDVLLDGGWKELSTHFVNGGNLESILKMLHGFLDEGDIKVIVNYESVAYGNMEGTITIWTKSK